MLQLDKIFVKRGDEMKRLLQLHLCFVLLIISLLIVTPNTTQAYLKRGIDVSKWNKTVNWPAVKANGIDFAILRH